MSARALSLPIRAFSRPQIAQQAERYTCRRCLHGTQAQAQEATPVQQTDAQTHLTPAPLGLLKRVLPHSIRPQLLQHVDPERLHGREREAALNAQKHAEIVGFVVRTGRMEKTVSVRVPKQRWEPRIKKYFADHENHLVHDPNNSLNQGDVIKMHRLKVSTAVHHVVASIVTPFGTPIESRPPIPTPEERLAAYKAKRLPQLQRRSLRRKAAEGSAEAIAELKRQGLDPGAGAVPGKGETSGTEKGAGKVRNPKEGALMGKKGQKLPKGVLPGGKHEVGKIDARAKHNKEAALKMQGQAKANLKRAQ